MLRHSRPRLRQPELVSSTVQTAKRLHPHAKPNACVEAPLSRAPSPQPSIPPLPALSRFGTAAPHPAPASSIRTSPGRRSAAAPLHCRRRSETTATPMLADIGTCCPLIATGWQMALRIFCATCSASMPSPTFESTTANSSPPSRATVSTLRTAPPDPLRERAKHEVAGRHDPTCRSPA